MSIDESIKKALLENRVNKEDKVFVTTDTNALIGVSLFDVMLFALSKFALYQSMNATQIYNFVMKNFENIFDDIITQSQLALFYASMNYKELKEIELSDKTKGLFLLFVQCNVLKELEKYIMM